MQHKKDQRIANVLSLARYNLTLAMADSLGVKKLAQ